jgi:hypothetical protein
LDVGEDDMDIGAGFEDGDCLVGVASTTSKPASATVSAALIRSSNSSSTMRTTGRLTAKAIPKTPSFAVA